VVEDIFLLFKIPKLRSLQFHGSEWKFVEKFQETKEGFSECGEGMAELALSIELLTIPINFALLVLLVQILVNEEECKLVLHIKCRL
jgi:hypothetical protein